MKIPHLLTLITLVGFVTSRLGAASPDVRAAAKADEERIAATIAGDVARMNAIFSDDLVYVHSTGLVNHKADLIETLGKRTLQYKSIDYEVRQFQAVAPGIVLMRGRCRIRTEANGVISPNHLGFLAVFRNEGGTWRFLAWQSCKLPPDSPPWPK